MSAMSPSCLCIDCAGWQGLGEGHGLGDGHEGMGFDRLFVRLITVWPCKHKGPAIFACGILTYVDPCRQAPTSELLAPG